MSRLLLLCFLTSIYAQENSSCFPNCNGEGPQERWRELAQWIKKEAPAAHIDERIVMAPGRFGDQVTSTAVKIKKGEVLLRMPLQIFLLEEDCFPTEEFQRLGSPYSSSLKKLPKHPWNTSKPNVEFTRVAICLLIHRLLGNQSRFETYIRHLPQRASQEIYMFRNLSDFDDLRGTDSYRVLSYLKTRHVAALDETTDEAFQMIQDYFPSLNWTKDRMKRELEETLSLCGSRTFNLDSVLLAPSLSGPKIVRPTLVPLLDLFNHEDTYTRNCLYFFNTTHQHFQLQAIRDIAAGEELSFSYGARGNSELLTFYGFMVPKNGDDFVAVTNLAIGALDYNYHSRLGHDLRCHTPFFRPIQGSAWPPTFHTVIPNASRNADPRDLNIGPLPPYVYRLFMRKLQQPLTENTSAVFAQLSNSRGAVLQMVEGEFVVTQTANLSHNESIKRGNLTVNLIWRGASRPSGCEEEVKPRCELFAPVTSVNDLVFLLQKDLLPGAARAGGCLAWSESKQQMYDISWGPDNKWHAASSESLPSPGLATEYELLRADLLTEFQFKRYIISRAGLSGFTDRIFRNGLMPDTLAAVRIAVLPALSSYAIHTILSRKRAPEFEQQVAKTLGMFCFEELTRRLQVLGVNTEEISLSLLITQSRSLLGTEAQGSYELLARNELGIVTDFCSSVATWGLSIWTEV